MHARFCMAFSLHCLLMMYGHQAQGAALWDDRCDDGSMAIECKDGNGRRKSVCPRAPDPAGADTGVDLCLRARARILGCAQRALTYGQ